MSLIPDHYGSKLPASVVPPASYEEACDFFGWSSDYFALGREQPLPDWEHRLTIITLPARLVFAGQPVLRVRVHERCAAWAAAALAELHVKGLWDFLNPYGGSYNFRLMRGGSRLSAHAFGAAFDFDPGGNPLGASMSASRFGSEARGMDAVRVLEEWGWFWGGRFISRPDPMHFQFGVNW